jgi:hypothetical protein
MRNEVPSSPCGWSEAADEWLQRCRRQLYQSSAPIDPSSAAWAFVQWKEDSVISSSGGYGTGISFIDLILQKHHEQPQTKIPIIDILGEAQSGKTWTLLSVAARFVVATCPSAFASTSKITTATSGSLPQVVIFDSNYNITASKLAYTVRATLLLQYGNAPFNSDQFQKDMEFCLARIHIAVASDMLAWVPILETLRYKLMSMTEHPTLLLWDDFLSPPSDNVARTEVIRQLTRLLQDCCVFLITTSSKYRRYEWAKLVTHRIRLERVASNSRNEVDTYIATVNKDHVPYSLSLGGVLF